MQMLPRIVPHCLSRQFSTVDLDQVCQLVTQLTHKGGEMIMKSLAEKPKYTTKSDPRDVVTQTDKDVERMYIRVIKEACPGHEIIAEEGTEGAAKSNILTESPTWLIDPIDGTMNFVHGFPQFCTSLALYVKKKGEFGLVYNPMLKHTFAVRRGRGVYFNDRQMRVSGQRDLKKSLICLEWSLRHNEAGVQVAVENISKLLPQVHGIRSFGSAALNLSLVAIGACDAYLQFGPHIWDWAAGVLMVQEAGGVVIDPCGGQFDIHSRRALAAASPELAEQILPLVSQLFPLPRDDAPSTLGKA